MVFTIATHVAVVVHAHHVYPFIAGITVKKLRFGGKSVVGRKGIQKIVHAQTIPQVTHGKTPERNKFLPCAMPGAPPKPVAVKFVKRPEDEWYRLAVGAFQALRPIADAF